MPAAPGHDRPVSAGLTALAPDGVGEVRPGDDLAALLLDAVGRAGISLLDGDILAVTSKVVSKAEGRLRTGMREDALATETARVVARRGPTSIVRNRIGLTMAAAGIDASNVPAGTIALLPEDPDASARRLRSALQQRTGRTLAVLLTDTAGRAWREGQTDIAIGVAGLTPLQTFAGHEDRHGNPLAVTAPAVADELASAAELAAGKLADRPFVVLRGRADLVGTEDGPGAVALVRPAERDMFALGAREAVVAALAGDPETAPLFGSPATADELCLALRTLGVRAAVESDESVSAPVPLGDALRAVAYAHGWRACPENATTSLFLPGTP